MVNSAAYELAFFAMNRTFLGRKYGISAEPTVRQLYVSTEFSRTVDLPAARSTSHDDFMRPIQWILWSEKTEIAMIIIPEEAEKLLQIVRSTPSSPTHMLTYAAPITRKMIHFNNLNYYSTPALTATWKAPGWLSAELGIFAGRTYFAYTEYAELCKVLGNSDAKGESDKFTKKPLSFLQEWIAVRRKEQDFTHTPMGHVCNSFSPFSNSLRLDHNSSIYYASWYIEDL